MAKKEKEKSVKDQEIKTLKIDDKEYDATSMSDEQKTMLNHVADLDRKIQGSEFNLVQLRFGRQAFIDGLKASLDDGEQK
jgi:hypothetical protein|tara:strand:+ start:688 stop:927 length:240 start_codon:yes stop_codon:yes gene_type:complete